MVEPPCPSRAGNTRLNLSRFARGTARRGFFIASFEGFARQSTVERSRQDLHWERLHWNGDKQEEQHTAMIKRVLDDVLKRL